jgi:hypothetical protein
MLIQRPPHRRRFIIPDTRFPLSCSHGQPLAMAAFVSDGHGRITLWQVQGAVYIEFDRKKNLGLHHLALKVSDVAEVAL